MGYPTDMTDAQWGLVRSKLPVREGAGRPTEVDLRRVIDALTYLNRTGCQWRMIPSDFPPPGTVRYYFDKWNADGTLLDLHDSLLVDLRRLLGREDEPTLAIVDRRSVKTTEAGGQRGFDGRKKAPRSQAPDQRR